MGYNFGDILITDGYGTLFYIDCGNDDSTFFGTSDENECKKKIGHFYPLSCVKEVIGNIEEDSENNDEIFSEKECE